MKAKRDLELQMKKPIEEKMRKICITQQWIFSNAFLLVVKKNSLE